jgi:apolipoprotein N-acyltransferase
VLFGATKVRFNAEALRRGETEFDELYNSAWFIPAGGRIDPDARQDKMRLVPFGEFLPFGGVLPFIRTAVGMEDFDAGREVRLFDVKGAKFGAMVCFESAYAAQSRLIARQGADFLAVITNDGWYGRSAGPTQHHALSRLRAVETRRPVVRSANTGISSIVDPAGRLTATLELEKSGAAVGGIAPHSAATLFMKWGSLWLMSACAALLLVLLVQGRIAEKAATAPAK